MPRRNRTKRITVNWYATEEWDPALRADFALPGDPYDSSLARETLGNLSVFAYRDENHGHILFTEPAKPGNLPEDFFSSGLNEFNFDVPQRFYAFMVELLKGEDGVFRPAGVPDTPELQPTRNKRQRLHGDALLWHRFNEEVFLRQINTLIAKK